jgi:hypothetical protein
MLDRVGTQCWKYGRVLHYHALQGDTWMLADVERIQSHRRIQHVRFHD